jgi:hypothetical protein
MWQAISWVSGSVSLLAFFAAVGAWSYRRRLDGETEIVRSAPDADRARVILAKYGFLEIDTDKLTRKQNFALAMTQLRTRARQVQLTALLVLAFGLIAAVLTAVAILKNASDAKITGQLQEKDKQHDEEKSDLERERTKKFAELRDVESKLRAKLTRFERFAGGVQVVANLPQGNGIQDIGQLQSTLKTLLAEVDENYGSHDLSAEDALVLSAARKTYEEALAVSNSSPAAQESARDLRGLAESVKRFLDTGNRIKIGEFATRGSDAPQLGITLMLRQLLQQMNIVVDDRASLDLGGDIRFGQRNDGRNSIEIEARIRDSSGEDRFRQVITMTSELAIVAMLRNSCYLLPSITTGQNQRAQELRASIKTPRIAISNDTRASPMNSRNETAPFGIEILVDGQPRKLEDQEGKAFVSLRRGEKYSVKLVNNWEFETAVALEIDGVSMFSISKERNNQGDPLFKFVIVGPSDSLVIPGWHIERTLSRPFTLNGGGDALELGGRGAHPQVSVISARFHSAFEKVRPPDEPPDDGTGQGPSVIPNYREVKRHIGVLRAAVSVRYRKNVN